MMEPGSVLQILHLDESVGVPGQARRGPAVVVLTRANCGAAMDERKCKLICRCGYFVSCPDDD